MINVDAEEARVLLQMSLATRHILIALVFLIPHLAKFKEAGQRCSWEERFRLAVIIPCLCLFLSILSHHSPQLFYHRFPAVRQTELADGHLLDDLASFHVNESPIVVMGISINRTENVERISHTLFIIIIAVGKSPEPFDRDIEEPCSE